MAGYDLPKLLTGSLGTLGIIAEMTLKVRPAPEASALAWSFYADLKSASEALEGLNTSSTRPVLVELLNAPGSREIGLDRPDGWTLVIGFEDNQASVDWQSEQIASELAPGRPTILRDLDAEPIAAALVESQALGDGPIRFQANVRPSALAPFLDGIDPGLWSIQAHAGNGIVRGLARVEVDDPLATEVGRIRALAKGLGGSLILPRCPTAWKQRLKVWGDPRPDWALAEKVKRALDPAGVVNPGRFVVTI